MFEKDSVFDVGFPEFTIAGRFSPSPRVRNVVFTVAGGLALCVALVVLRYAFAGAAAAPPEMVTHIAERPLSFYLHIAGGGVALFCLPWQFLRRVRERYSWAHRTAGLCYVMACVIGGVAGLHLAVNSVYGPVASAGFGVLSVVWMGTALIGLGFVIKGDIVRHRRWMIRSAALTMAAVTLRLYVPFLFAAGLDINTIFGIVAWLSWMPNLAVAEAGVRYFAAERNWLRRAEAL